ncbi:MAG: hypothetical protein QOD06_332 [Candidatus Binatota bacterium]|nr:hypothetical protein [Candidatus Binatota bacterium]
MTASRRHVWFACLLAIVGIAAGRHAGADSSHAAMPAAYERWQAVQQRLHDVAVERHVHPSQGFAAPAAVSAGPMEAAVTVRSVRRISRDSTAPRPGSEPDTEVEPDVAVDPDDDDVVVAVFQQNRFPNGGAVATGYATSHDGGDTWVTAPLPGVTRAREGPWARASDPAVAFGPDGSVYVSSLTISRDRCTTGIMVQRSDDGGLTFETPVQVERHAGCDVSNDKEWITVDTFPASPHFGRIYVVWSRITGNDEPLQIRHSDDRGRTWTSRVQLSGNRSGVGVLPLVQPNGDLTVVYTNLNSLPLRGVARTSRDGGSTFGAEVVIGNNLASSPSDLRVGEFLVTAAVDPVTGELYAGWADTRFRSDGLNDVLLWKSGNGGGSWSGPVKVNGDGSGSGIDKFTPDVAVHGGIVHATYRTRTREEDRDSNLVYTAYQISTDGGRSFGAPVRLGARTALRWAAEADGLSFLGDYQGVAATAGGAYAVWCRASRPPGEGAYHQTAWSAALER